MLCNTPIIGWVIAANNYKITILLYLNEKLPPLSVSVGGGSMSQKRMENEYEV